MSSTRGCSWKIIELIRPLNDDANIWMWPESDSGKGCNWFSIKERMDLEGTFMLLFSVLSTKGRASWILFFSRRRERRGVGGRGKQKSIASKKTRRDAINWKWFESWRGFTSLSQDIKGLLDAQNYQLVTKFSREIVMSISHLFID